MNVINRQKQSRESTEHNYHTLDFCIRKTMHRCVVGHNPNDLFILTKDIVRISRQGTLLTIEHMAMFVVKSI